MGVTGIINFLGILLELTAEKSSETKKIKPWVYHSKCHILFTAPILRAKSTDFEKPGQEHRGTLYF